MNGRLARRGRLRAAVAGLAMARWSRVIPSGARRAAARRAAGVPQTIRVNSWLGLTA